MSDQRDRGINIDPAYVRALAEMLDETGLSEIEVEDGERKIRVARTMQTVAAPVYAAPAAPAPAAPAAAAAPAAETHANAVKSPMVGTVYLSSEPGSPEYAVIGSTVAAGDTILIIEAMKVMNPIVAPADGTLQAVHVENSQPVEFDQPLFTIS